MVAAGYAAYGHYLSGRGAGRHVGKVSLADGRNLVRYGLIDWNLDSPGIRLSLLELFPH